MDVKAQQDCKIFPIIRLDRTELKFSSSEITNKDIKEFGNGFFISNNGLFASVAHVILSDEYLNHYALINDMLYKIDILISKHGFNNETYEDFFIGKIDIDNKNWFDINDFKEVDDNEDLLLMGYSRNLNIETNNLNFDFDFPKNNFHEIQLNKPFLLFYLYLIDVSSRTSIRLNNSFSIVTRNIKLHGLSGSPIVNRSNKNEIFGFLKGGGKFENNTTIAQVYKIKVIQDLISDITNK